MRYHPLFVLPSSLLLVGLVLGGCATESTTESFDPFAPVEAGGSAGSASNAGGTRASGDAGEDSGASGGSSAGTDGQGGAASAPASGGSGSSIGSGGTSNSGGSGSTGSGSTSTGSTGSGGAGTGGSGTSGGGRGGSSGASSGGSFGNGGSATGGAAGTSSGGVAGSSAGGASGGTSATGGAGGSAGAGGSVVDVLLSAGKAALADSEETSKGNVASLGNDGSSTSRWCAADGKAGHYWQVDLGESYALAKVEVAWEKAVVYKYKIEGSLDGNSFSTLADRAGNTASTASSRDVFSNGPAARYVRLTVTGLPANNVWASFFELAVYGH